MSLPSPHSTAAAQLQGSRGGPAKYLDLVLPAPPSPPGSGEKRGDWGREPETALGHGLWRTGAGG